MYFCVVLLRLLWCVFLSFFLEQEKCGKRTRELQSPLPAAMLVYYTMTPEQLRSPPTLSPLALDTLTPRVVHVSTDGEGRVRLYDLVAVGLWRSGHHTMYGRTRNGDWFYADDHQLNPRQAPNWSSWSQTHRGELPVPTLLVFLLREEAPVRRREVDAHADATQLEGEECRLSQQRPCSDDDDEEEEEEKKEEHHDENAAVTAADYENVDDDTISRYFGIADLKKDGSAMIVPPKGTQACFLKLATPSPVGQRMSQLRSFYRGLAHRKFSPDPGTVSL
jgi:hypothetical protein